MIARRTLLVLLNNAVGAGIGFFALLLITRYYPKGAYGYFGGASALIGIATILTTLGFVEAHVRRVNQGMDEGRANGTFLAAKVCFTLAFIAFFFVGDAVWTRVLHKPYSDVTYPILVVVLASYALLSLRQFFDTVFRAHQHTARGESVLLVDTAFSFLGIGAGALVLARQSGHDVPFEGVADALARFLNVQGPLGATESGVVLATGYLLGRLVSLGYAGLQFLVHRYPLGPPSWDLARSYARFGFPLTIAAGLTVLYGSLDRIYLLFFWTAGEVANYSLAYAVLGPVLMLGVALGGVLFPSISRFEAAGNVDGMRETTEQAERYLLMTVVPFVILAFVFANEGIHVYNDAYQAAAPVVRFLVFFFVFNVLSTPARVLIFSTERLRVLTHLGIMNLVVVLSLNTLLIPPSILGVPLAGLKETGAAMVAALGGFLSYLYLKHHVRAIVPSYIPRGAARQVPVALAFALVCWAAKVALGPGLFDRFWKLVIVAAVVCLLWFLLLILVREFRRSDWHFLVDLVHPGKFAGYVVGELRGTPKQP